MSPEQQGSSSFPLPGATAFALMEWVDYEGSYLYGIYSSREKADEALSTFKRRKDFEVHEVPIDAAPHYVD